MFYGLLHLTVTAKEKAAAAFVVSTIGTYMAQNGLTWHDVLSRHGVYALVVGIVTHQAVYWTRNKV